MVCHSLGRGRNAADPECKEMRVIACGNNKLRRVLSLAKDTAGEKCEEI